jgi:2-amino-4-hydroxy-6-hydroxymethyldihydropteridine diphosphokinase
MDGSRAPSLYLGLGSNKGDSRAILAGAISRLSIGLEGVAVSSFFSTKPMYLRDQGDFLNCVLRADLPRGAALDFLDLCQAIEARWGRDRSRERPKGERSLDIDILLWGDAVIDHPRLAVPHPLMRERKFVLLPLLELDPDARAPDGSGAYLESLDALEDQGIYYASLAEYASILP